MFSCEICEIFKNTYFEEHLWTTASKKYLWLALYFRRVLPYQAKQLEIVVVWIEDVYNKWCCRTIQKHFWKVFNFYLEETSADSKITLHAKKPPT